MYIPWWVSHYNSEFSQNSHIKEPQVTLYPLENQNKKIVFNCKQGNTGYIYNIKRDTGIQNISEIEAGNYGRLLSFRVRTLSGSPISMTLGLAVTFENFQTFTCLSIFLSLNSSTETTWCPPKCVPFAPFNYSSLSYIILALSSAATNLPNKTLIFHDFLEPKLKTKRLHSLTFQVFHDLYKPCK